MAMANLPFPFVKFAISPLAPPPPPRLVNKYCNRLVNKYCNRLVNKYCNRLVNKYCNRLVNKYYNRLVNKYCNRLVNKYCFWRKFKDCSLNSTWLWNGKCIRFNLNPIEILFKIIKSIKWVPTISHKTVKITKTK